MPLPTDEKLIALAQDLLHQFDTIFGLHPGFRPAHAKGIMLTGTFTPRPIAKTLANAPHFGAESTPVTVRFSDSTGIPLIPDSDPNASPRGMAIRFHLGERIHTDIVSHSTDGFPTHTGAEFLEFLTAIAASSGATEHPTPVEAYVGSHPAALAFVQAPKPTPSSFARESYFGVTAMRFTPQEGSVRYGRYRIIPVDGTEFFDDATSASKPPNYLFEELISRVATAPVEFKIAVQIAEEGDEVNNSTVHWPEERQILEIGTLKLTDQVADQASEQKQIIFDPIPRVDGIDPSDDPLLELRAAIYLLSGRRRRAASTE